MRRISQRLTLLRQAQRPGSTCDGPASHLVFENGSSSSGAVKPCGLDWVPEFTGTGPIESWHTLNNANADPMRMMRFLSEPRATAE